MATQPRLFGSSIKRREDPRLITGAASYTDDFVLPGMVHLVMLRSPHAHARIKRIDTTQAKKAPGVLAVYTGADTEGALKSTPCAWLVPNSNLKVAAYPSIAKDIVRYVGDIVAAVVADTLEHARYAASLLKISYAAKTPALDREHASKTDEPKEVFEESLQEKKGDVAAALANSDFVKIENTYSTPTETHNPMECSATVAVWDAPDRLTIYDATQYVKGAQGTVARAFGLKRENVRVICPFVGGAFGCKGPVWPHTILAVMAAKVVGRPVKLELTRQEMFSGTGHRTPTFQTVALAAGQDGKLQGIRHRSEMVTSPVGHWVEGCGIGSTNVLYDAPSIEFNHIVHTVNVAQPSFMRAPGECPGTYALECAMDELAYALKMDPLKLRMVNDSPNHPVKGIPWSAKYLRECYDLGAKKFGWSRRNHQPRSMKDGSLLVGWGVATATYPAHAMRANVHIKLNSDGTALVHCAAHDLGTGAYTALTQISADAIGLPVEKVKFELGDSDLPFGPVAGGSNTTGTVGSAVADAAKNLKKKLADLAGANAKSSDSPGEILKRAGINSIEADGKFESEENEKLGFQSFGAHFCEVKVDPDLPLVRVTRWVSVMNCGRVINLKTGSSQILGGIVMGVGMALEEETVYDPATGLPATRNLADYHVPVHADIHSIEVHFVGEPDYAFNPMGARGMGEIGITGAAAAVANAVYHATGKRIRDLPITIDKLI